MLISTLFSLFQRAQFRRTLARRNRRAPKFRSSLHAAQVGRAETLESRQLLTVIGVEPLVFDPTPSDSGSGDEITVGTITFDQSATAVAITFAIDPARQSTFDLTGVSGRINDGLAGSAAEPSLPNNTHTFTLIVPLTAGATLTSVDASAALKCCDPNVVSRSLPKTGTVQGMTLPGPLNLPSYFDSSLTAGFKPSSTNVAADTLSFSPSGASWQTGDAVRVVQGFGQGLVPVATNPTAGVETLAFGQPHGLSTGNLVSVAETGGGLTAGTTYAARVINPTTIALYDSSANANAGGTTGLINLTGPVATKILGTSPTGFGPTPHVAKTTTTSASLFVRNLGGGNYSFYTTYQAALAGGSSGLVDITNPAPTNGELVVVAENADLGFLGQVPINQSAQPSATDTTLKQVSFASDPNFATATPVRVSATGGGLTSGTTYFIRNLGSGIYSFYDTAANATAGGATGLRNLTAPITASVFPNPTTLTFPNNHGFTTGKIVRTSTAVGGLVTGTNYFVRVIDERTISLHSSLGDAVANTNPRAVTAPITSVITPMFDSWCADVDRVILNNFNPVCDILSTQSAPLPHTSLDPKDVSPAENGTATRNGSLVPSSTNTTTDQVTFTAAHQLATGEPVRISTTSNNLLAGVTYFARSINTTTVAFYNTAANALAGTTVGRIDLTAPISASATVYRSEWIDLVANTNWTTGTKVRFTATGGGVVTDTTYFLRAIDANTFSLHTSRADSLSGTSPIPLTGPLPSGINMYVYETIVEHPENLDVINWLLNQSFQTQLAPGQALASTDIAAETVTFTASHGLLNGFPVRVSTTGGGLTAGVDYFARVVNNTTISFYDTAANASAGGATGLINLTAPITAAVQSYYTYGDLQHAIWRIVDNLDTISYNTLPFSQARVDSIIAQADAAVGLYLDSVDFTPACGQDLIVLAEPIEPGVAAGVRAQSLFTQVPNRLFGTATAQVAAAGQISGLKFNDLTGDGHRDPSDPGLQGFTIYLDLNNNAILDTGEPSTVSDANGEWAFSGLAPGNYVVRELNETGWVQTTAVPALVTLTATAGETLDIGNFRLISLSGLKFNDANGSGTLDTNETGLAGWTIFLDTNSNNLLDLGERSTVTGNNGTWRFDNVGPGNYNVREVNQNNWIRMTNNPATFVATSGSNTTGILFGNTHISLFLDPKLMQISSNMAKYNSGVLGQKAQLIANWYDLYLKRAPDRAGMTRYMKLYLAGFNDQQVEQRFRLDFGV
jgi:hypothetical protein